MARGHKAVSSWRGVLEVHGRLIPVLLLTALSTACSTYPPGPRDQISAAQELLYKGDLAGFYEQMVPSSYQRDLQDILNQLQLLVAEDEYDRARELVHRLGADLAVQVETDLEESDPLGRLMGESLRDVPGLLGVDSYQSFQKATVIDMLKSLQVSSLSQALRHPDSLAQWSRQEVELIELQPNSATLRVRGPETDADTEEKVLNLLLVEDKWVPRDIALEWDRRMESAGGLLAELRRRKERNPDLIREKLSRFEERLGHVTTVIAQFLAFSTISVDGGESPDSK